jgi:transcriptional regulator with XRE-family HTH domain
MRDQVNPELGEFLRTRRARLTPGEVGLSGAIRRRVPGLRREELARVAGVSPDYYTRLEQGRHHTASPAVLDSLASALRLRPSERSHLYALAGAAGPSLADDGLADGNCDGDGAYLRQTLDIFGGTPAVLCAAFSDILAANDAACFLYDTDFGGLPAAERNTLHWILTSPTARSLYGEAWEQSSTEIIGKLRMDSGRQPDHPRVRALVAQLNRDSELFRRVWAQHEISTCVQGVKTLRHPLGDVIRVRSDAVTVHSSPGQVFYLMVPVDDTFDAAYKKRFA